MVKGGDFTARQNGRQPGMLVHGKAAPQRFAHQPINHHRLHVTFLQTQQGHGSAAEMHAQASDEALQAQRAAKSTVDATAIAAAPTVRQAMQQLERDNAWTLQQQRELCEIPAPPFKEAARAAEYLRRMQALGLVNGRIDAEGNAIAERPGSSGPTVVVVGHLDTVPQHVG